MPTRRPGLSALLVGGAVILLVSIFVGQKIGDRVLLQTERRVPLGGGGITPVPEAVASERAELKNWKRLQVVAVATDPGFPDPRVTRPPTPTPTPYVAPTAPPAPRRTPTPLPTARGGIYTSPPLPLPIVSHEPGEFETEPPTLPPAPPLP